jgi:hypothetical protein
MSNGFPTGTYTIRTSNVTTAFPVGGRVVIEDTGSEYALQVNGGPTVSMEPDGALCLRTTVASPYMVICPTALRWIGGLVSAFAADTNGGGQWTAEEGTGGGGDPE